MIRKVAFLSYHTCPLIPPGSGDAGGMNVYIDELASIMARPYSRLTRNFISSQASEGWRVPA